MEIGPGFAVCPFFGFGSGADFAGSVARPRVGGQDLWIARGAADFCAVGVALSVRGRCCSLSLPPGACGVGSEVLVAPLLRLTPCLYGVLSTPGLDGGFGWLIAAAWVGCSEWLRFWGLLYI